MNGHSAGKPKPTTEPTLIGAHDRTSASIKSVVDLGEVRGGHDCLMGKILLSALGRVLCSFKTIGDTR